MFVSHNIKIYFIDDYNEYILIHFILLIQAKMRQSHKWQGAQTKRKNNQIHDLVTHKEHRMASQMTDKSYGTTNRTFLQTTTSQKQIDDFQDVLAEQLNLLFITPEEEEVIVHILELARKGKINPSNAFQLPLKVINPHSTQNSNMRFWKFASQLLKTSMNIYDKRVQNVFLNSNKMADNLVRSKRRPQDQFSEGQTVSRSRKKKRELVYIDIEDLQSAEAISMHEIKHMHIEETAKLNMNLSKFLSQNDPFFSKRMQLFDSNILSGLFCNVFQTGTNCQIKFLSSFIDQTENEVSICLDDQNEIQEVLCAKQMKKLSFIADNRALFDSITYFRKDQHRLFDVQQQRTQLDYVSIYDELAHCDSTESIQSTQVKLNESYQIQSAEDLVHLDPNMLNEEFFRSDFPQMQVEESHCLSEKTPSEKTDNTDLLGIRQCFTTMSAWQLEFKGMKLQKKKDRTKSKSIKPRTNLNLQIIEFDYAEQSKIDILQTKEEDCLLQFSRVRPFFERFLLPKIMHPYFQKLQQRKPPKNPTISSLGLIPQTHESQSFFQQLTVKMQHPFDTTKISSIGQEKTHHFSQMQQQLSYMSILESQTESIVLDPMNSECLRNMKTFGLKNIREVKISIYEELLKRKSIAISEIQIPISPAGILIIFLHLVNEKNLIVRSFDGENDVRLSLQ